MRLKLEAAALIGLILLIAVPAIAYAELPDRVPTHFDGAGKPDAWGSKTSIWILPATGGTMFLLLTLVTGYAGRKAASQAPPEHAAARAALDISLITGMKAQMTWLLAYLTWRTIEVSHGRADDLGVIFWLFLALIPVILGSYFVRRSKFS